MLEGPVMLTNTHSVGTVHEATIAWRVKHGDPDASGYWWSTPVVAETWDGEPERRQRLPREGRARRRGARRREGRAGRRRQRGRRHRHDLPRVQVRHRHGLAPRRRARAHATRSACWCRRTTARARALRIAGVPVGQHLRDGAGATRPRPTATTARSSSWSRPTRRCCRTSSTASRGAPAWDSRAWVPSPATARATSSSPSRRRTRSPWKARLIARRRVPRQRPPGRRCSRRPCRRPRKRSSTRWWPRATCRATPARSAVALPHDALVGLMKRYGRDGSTPR